MNKAPKQTMRYPLGSPSPIRILHIYLFQAEDDGSDEESTEKQENAEVSILHYL